MRAALLAEVLVVSPCWFFYVYCTCTQIMVESTMSWIPHNTRTNHNSSLIPTLVSVRPAVHNLVGPLCGSREPTHGGRVQPANSGCQGAQGGASASASGCQC